MRKKKHRWLPYWLFGNEQHCAGCEAPHAHAVEARCVGCDRPQCPVCIEIVEGEVFCSACLPKSKRVRSGKA
ncbi:MAG: hypothetical protein ABI779_27215 [Acidobacteriota bacterium]